MLKNKFWHLLVMLIVPLFAFGQGKQKSMQLISDETKQPVIFANYVYGGQQGSSDEQGFIQIIFEPGEKLIISHVEFGQKSFPSQSIEYAFEKGVLFIPPGKPMSLQPVTIIALHHHGLPLSIDDDDRLSHDAGSVLTRLPAVSTIKKSGRYGFDPVLRGFKYDQLNIVIDGLQSVAAACPNRMDPPASHIPLNQMEKVEIHKGPHALRFGPSFGGVINFISQQPALGEGRKTVGRLSTAYENNGSLYRMEGILGSEREKMALYFKGMWSQGNDYLDGSGMKVPAHFKRGSVGINGIYRPNDVQQVDFSITRNFARNVDFAGLAMDLVSDDSWLSRIGHTIHYNKRINTWSTTGFVSLVDHFMDNMSKTLDPRMANAETPATTRTYGGRSEINLKLNKTWAYIGGDVKIDEASGYRKREFLMGPNAGTTVVDNAWQDARISRAGIFTEYHVNPDPYHFIVSARFDLNHAAIRHAATEYTVIHGNNSIMQLNPSVSLGIIREIARDIDIGLWLGRGQRSGSITERFINFFPVGLDPYELVGNPDLKPESNNQVDLNLNINKERYRISYNLFSSWLQEFISSEIIPDLSPRLPTSPGVRMFTNIKNARLSGFEASWVQTWPLNLQHQVDVAYVYGKNILKYEPLPEIPPLDLRLRLSGKFFKNKLMPEISLRQVLSQKRISSSFGETATGSFTLIGVKASYYFDQYLKISGGVDNLFDKAYHEHLNRRFSGTDRNILNPGRNIFLVLSFDLGN